MTVQPSSSRVNSAAGCFPVS